MKFAEIFIVIRAQVWFETHLVGHESNSMILADIYDNEREQDRIG
jgi:hypothetical protein